MISGLTQVEVREGDAYDTGLPRGSFDGGQMRLVLVNVPKAELIVRELVSLVRPVPEAPTPPPNRVPVTKPL